MIEKDYLEMMSFINKNDHILHDLLLNEKQDCGIDNAVIRIMKLYADHKMNNLKCDGCGDPIYISRYCQHCNDLWAT